MSIAGNICDDVAATITAAAIEIDGVAVSVVSQSLPFPGTYGTVLANQIIVSPSMANRQTWEIRTQSGDLAMVDTTINIELIGKASGDINTMAATYDNALDAIAYAVLNTSDRYGSILKTLVSSSYLSDEAARKLGIYHAGYQVSLDSGAVSIL